ncbi:hypothetical protein F2Q69_00058880 [Brassica cretica]|uniref:Uncharacterized protein n=1 Tax=Brassica cretica TaxID=69181 RepID=A0A8S9RSL0_BRACR|nr:hypothetical protein F2Q69_00058880 [Brassica cretica]
MAFYMEAPSTSEERIGSTVRLLRSIVPPGKTPILAPIFTLLPSALQSTPDLK